MLSLVENERRTALPPSQGMPGTSRCIVLMMQTSFGLQKDVKTLCGNFKGNDIVSFDQFSIEDLHIVFELTRRMKDIAVNNRPSQLLAGMVVALLFFEPSSRTFGSFSSAIKRLGGQSIDI